MKVFVFCFAICLATAAVKATPIEAEDDNEVVVEKEQIFEPIQMFSGNEKSPENRIEHEDVHSNEAAEKMINDELASDDQVAVPDELKDLEGEKFQIDEVEVELTQEEKERIIGIEIPLCMQYSDYRYPLHLSHLTDCGKFYKCYWGRGYLMDCPADEHWSVRLNRCDYPDLAKCHVDGTHQFKVKQAKPMRASEQDPEDTEKPELGVFEIDPRCEGSDPFKPLHFKHINDCNKFYKCYMGKAYVIKCPRGQQWAQHLQRCEHPQIARCSIIHAAIKPAQAELEFTGEELEEEDDDDVYEHTIVDDADYMIRDPRCAAVELDRYHPVQFSHPTDCSMFYKCIGLTAYKTECPTNLHFSEKHQYCDYPQYARCRAFQAFYPAQAMIEEAAAESDEYDDTEPSILDDPDYQIEDPRCIPDEVDIFHPIHFTHPSDCTMFYKCFDHKAYKAQCPFNLHFNEEEQICDYPSQANCKAVPVFAQASSTFESIPECPKTGMANYPVENVKNEYFQCRDGFAYLMDCASGLEFNAQSQKCETSKQTGTMNQYPNMQFPGIESFPGMMNQFPMQYPGMYPGQFPQMQYPGQFQPQPVAPVNPQAPVRAPQIPNMRPQRIPGSPEFPSWMPIPLPNIAQPEFPSPSKEKPSHEKPLSVNEFNYSKGRTSSRCPSLDEPMKPTHLSHESDCQKFYKCFNGRAFLMECPDSQEWSDELQRCDFHQFSNCDPVELIKKKIQN